MRIRDIETHRVETIDPNCTLLQAAQKMKALDVGSLPVCDGDKLIGMITDRDITIRATAEGRDPQLTRVGQIMTKAIVCCQEDQEVEEVAHLMEERQIRRIPVLDGNQRLSGIVSLGDLAVRTHNEPLAGEVLERVSETREESFGG